MKSLKLKITATIMVAGVGGLMAFKTSKYSSFYIYQCAGDGTCPVIGNIFNPNVAGRLYTNATTSTTSTLRLLCTDCTSTIKAFGE